MLKTLNGKSNQIKLKQQYDKLTTNDKKDKLFKFKQQK